MNKEKYHFKFKSFYCNLTRFFQTKQITICTGTIFSLQPTIFRPLPSSRRMNQSLLMHEKTVNDVVKTSFEMHFFFRFVFFILKEEHYRICYLETASNKKVQNYFKLNN